MLFISWHEWNITKNFYTENIQTDLPKKEHKPFTW